MRRIILTAAWLATDALIYLGAYVLAYFLKVGWILSSDLPFATFLSAVLLTIPGWLFVMVTMRNLALTRQQANLRNFLYIAYACMIGMAGFALVFYFLKAALFSRLLLLMGGAFSTITVFCWHVLFDQMQRRILRHEPPVYPLLVIGTNREAERLIWKLQRARSPFTPVAILDGRGSGKKEIAGVPVLGKLDKLEQVIRKKEISHLVQCDQVEQSINLLSACTSHGITYFLLPSLLGIVQQQEKVAALEGQQVVTVEPRGGNWQWFFR